MEIFPILYIHGKTGTVGMYSICFSTEKEAREAIEILQHENVEFEYHTHALELKLELQ